jgi:hypothetical protein
MSRAAVRRAERPVAQILAEGSDEDILDLRFCELPDVIEGTLIERRVWRLYRELEAKHLLARPHVWFSEEFFTPDDVLGFAVPFYLAHPRLMRLERAQMLEVEGAGEAECRRIMRHEAGHALDDLYGFHRRDRYRELFGDPKKRYPTSYRPRPSSRDHVINLAAWYAQAHPVEDFAETFAVWLNPYVDWRSEYRDWPALSKLEYVDALMREVAGVPPPAAARTEVEALGSLRRTLREHYRQRRAHFAWEWPANYDQELRRIFSDDVKDAEAPRATKFLRSIRSHLRTRIAEGTGVHAYAVDQLLQDMITRARMLGLRVSAPPPIITEKLLVMLTMHTATLLHVGYPKVAV